MLLDNVTFLFNHARKRGSTKPKHLENRHPIIIHLNCQGKHPFILGHLWANLTGKNRFADHSI